MYFVIIIAGENLELSDFQLIVYSCEHWVRILLNNTLIHPKSQLDIVFFVNCSNIGLDETISQVPVQSILFYRNCNSSQCKIWAENYVSIRKIFILKLSYTYSWFLTGFKHNCTEEKHLSKSQCKFTLWHKFTKSPSK